MSGLVYRGRVGVPKKGERKCPACNGSGVDQAIGYQLMGGCDVCKARAVEPMTAHPEFSERMEDE